MILKLGNSAGQVSSRTEIDMKEIRVGDFRIREEQIIEKIIEKRFRYKKQDVFQHKAGVHYK